MSATLYTDNGHILYTDNGHTLYTDNGRNDGDFEVFVFARNDEWKKIQLSLNNFRSTLSKTRVTTPVKMKNNNDNKINKTLI